MTERLTDYAVATLAVVLGAGSIVLFAWPNRPVFVPMGLTVAAALAWNTVWSLVFFTQHSVLVRRSVRARLAAFVAPRHDRACYAITSGFALALFAVLVQPVGPPLFELRGVARALVNGAALLAVAGFAWAAIALGSFDPLGLRPIRARLRGSPAAAADDRSATTGFVVRGPYRLVRHPLYSCVIVLLWANPELSIGTVVLAALWTVWIVAGTVLEERDLFAEFGETYREYQRRVPMLIPWRGAVRVAAGTESSPVA